MNENIAMTHAGPKSAEVLDIGTLLDNSKFSLAQALLVALAALSIILDGFDGQLIGFAIPSLIKEWGVTKADFAPVVAAGLFGMAIGSVGAGWVGDRLGRRVALIGAVSVFGVMTLALLAL